jgi:anti-sigma factor RsiW
MPEQTLIAGVRCGDVLERLSDYVDDELPPDERSRVQAHLRGCDWCARFGGEFAAVVASLRDALRTEPGPDPAVGDRLAARLDGLFLGAD